MILLELVPRTPVAESKHIAFLRLWLSFAKLLTRKVVSDVREYWSMHSLIHIVYVVYLHHFDNSKWYLFVLI